MHRIVPIIDLSGHLAIQAMAAGSNAVSAEAGVIGRAAGEIATSAEESVVLFGPKADALSALAELVSECSERGWDGQNAEPIDSMAAFSAERFIRAMPEDLPLPEFAAEPDGAISLDWIETRNRMLSLSISRGGRLAYAWVDGADHGHAVAQFNGLSVPSRIIAAIRDLTGTTNVGIRAA